ncbi:MAG: STAS domain-containing protein [Magnetococcales bacterium]|nr:STAS domain-containing protein [Magnetococcales bacterium]
MECQIWISGDVATITLPKEFSFNSKNEFRSAVKAGKPIYEVDFYKVEKIDSAALGMLLLLKEASKDKPATVTFRNVRPDILKMLQIVRFHELFTIV